MKYLLEQLDDLLLHLLEQILFKHNEMLNVIKLIEYWINEIIIHTKLS